MDKTRCVKNVPITINQNERPIPPKEEEKMKTQTLEKRNADKANVKFDVNQWIEDAALDYAVYFEFAKDEEGMIELFKTKLKEAFNNLEKVRKNYADPTIKGSKLLDFVDMSKLLDEIASDNEEDEMHGNYMLSLSLISIVQEGLEKLTHHSSEITKEETKMLRLMVYKIIEAHKIIENIILKNKSYRDGFRRELECL